MSLKSSQITPQLTCVVESSPGGIPLSSKILSLVLFHYDLNSTTVTGIPMKEEQNASSSANYDVEIVHPSIAHKDLYASGSGDRIKMKSPKEGCEYFSIPLKWCTPRSTGNSVYNEKDLTFTTSAVRFTPVDVNSRPSSCLTNFLLSGRTVLLEMQGRKKTLSMSHMLSSHDNELYIHSLSFGRTILEDPPSISEGTGGRVTDYRINDLGIMMKDPGRKLKRILAPGEDAKSDLSSTTVTPASRAKQYLKRQTEYWPLVYSNSLLFNLCSQFQDFHLLDLIPKDNLTAQDVADCKSCLYQVVSMESKGAPLPALKDASSSSTKERKDRSGQKREEQYKMLFKELAHFISVHATTNEHRAVLHSLLQLTNLDEESLSIPLASSASSSGQPSMPTLPTTMQAQQTKGDSDLNKTTNGNASAGTTDPRNDIKSDSNKRLRTENLHDLMPAPQESLLSFWTRRLRSEEMNKHPDFEGRINPVPLYAQLLAKQQEALANAAPSPS